MGGTDADRFLFFSFLRRQFFDRRKTLGRKPQLLFTLMKRIGRILQLLQEQTHRRTIAAANDLLASEKNLPDGVHVALYRQLFIKRLDDGRERIVDANDFLTFDHGRGAMWNVANADANFLFGSQRAADG